MRPAGARKQVTAVLISGRACPGQRQLAMGEYSICVDMKRKEKNIINFNYIEKSTCSALTTRAEVARSEMKAGRHRAASFRGWLW